MQTKAANIGAVQVETITEDPQGQIMVEAVAPEGRENDARPLCGYFFGSRRFAGDRFLISKPDQFSTLWMRFVDRPPEEWHDVLMMSPAEKLKQARIAAEKAASGSMPRDAKVAIDDLMVKQDTSKLSPMQRRELEQQRRNRAIPVGDLQGYTPGELDTSTGQVHARRRGKEQTDGQA
jgi:hypothetical protein